MAQVTIRNLDGAIYERLKARARLHSRSVEEEAHAILDGELRIGCSGLAAEAKTFRERLLGRYTGDVLAEIRADREHDDVARSAGVPVRRLGP